MHRIIENEGNPFWGEIAMLLIGPSEIHAKETLRLQLWDSGASCFSILLLSPSYAAFRSGSRR